MRTVCEVGLATADARASRQKVLSYAGISSTAETRRTVPSPATPKHIGFTTFRVSDVWNVACLSPKQGYGDQAMTGMTGLFVTVAMVVGVDARVGAAELQSTTVDAWQEFVRAASARMQARVSGGKPFLWLDEIPDRVLRVRRGEVIVAPLTEHGTQAVPGGLIHDWIGAIFIPNATKENLLRVVRDHDRYKEIYNPVVVDSRSLDSRATDQEFLMVWLRHVLFVNTAMQGWYRAHDITVDAHRGYIVVNTTRLQQIEDYGQRGEHLLPPDTGSGFLWRIHSISRYDERDGGVYLEIEAIALSRDIPASLQWLVNPVVNRLSVNSMATTLRQTREAVGTLQVAQRRPMLREHKGMN